MASYISLVSAFLLVSSVPLISAQSAFFGKLKGNHQPSRTESAALTVGGQVNPPNAVTTINNQDGGPCVDAYTQYCGPGGSSPPKSNWCSFEDMYVQTSFYTSGKMCRSDCYTGSIKTSPSCSPPAVSSTNPTIPDRKLVLFTTLFSKSHWKRRLTTASFLPL